MHLSLQPLAVFHSKEANLMQLCVHLFLVVAVATSAQIVKANLNVDEKQIILDLFNYLRALHLSHQLVRRLQRSGNLHIYFFPPAMGCRLGSAGPGNSLQMRPTRNRSGNKPLLQHRPTPKQHTRQVRPQPS